MAISASTPMVPMDPIGYQYQYGQEHYYLNEQQQQQYNHYQQAQITQAQYAPMPTPQSGALPVQHVNTPGLPVSSSHQLQVGDSRPWTAEMDEVLWEMKGRKTYKWDDIAEKFFHGIKSSNACRKRYGRLLQERKDPQRWEVGRVERLVDMYNEPGMREAIWRQLAERSGEKWEDVEKCILNQSWKQATRQVSSSHTRRRSQAASSHRSRASMNSNAGGATESYDDDEDDSGIQVGGEVQPSNEFSRGQMNGYADREDSYHDYGPESYYRAYHNGHQ